MSRSIVIGTLAAAALAACASTVPPELADARRAYQSARASDASTLAPAELLEAKNTLLKAEASFEENGDGTPTRDLAYLAQRKAQLAMVQADVREAARDKDAAEQELLALAEESSERLKTTAQRLDAERRARLQAERRMKDAINRLSVVAAIKDEARGTVITLPGGVLFESGKSQLLSSARERLDRVAEALSVASDAKMVVEGHTDSTGSDDLNQKLSEDRAAAVREYLVQRGVATERISAVGHGEKRPVADNASAEGRAINRRVEIVVGPGTAGSDAGG